MLSLVRRIVSAGNCDTVSYTLFRQNRSCLGYSRTLPYLGVRHWHFHGCIRERQRRHGHGGPLPRWCGHRYVCKPIIPVYGAKHDKDKLPLSLLHTLLRSHRKQFVVSLSAHSQDVSILELCWLTSLPGVPRFISVAQHKLNGSFLPRCTLCSPS